MMPPRRDCLNIWLLFACFLLEVAAMEEDLRCLQGVKAALSDPTESWNFSTNTTAGFICSFTGVSCWNPQENRILGLTLSSWALSGPIPSALRYCRYITNVDISSNSLYGQIPADLCIWLPFLVSLDLSANQLTGPIPPNLSNCSYLNVLNLSGNQLSGSIPNSLGSLGRLAYLDLSYNQLSGPVPPFLSDDTPASFTHLGLSNNQLSGPLSSFHGFFSSNPSLRDSRPTQSPFIIILSAGIGGTAASILLVAFLCWCLSHHQPADPSVWALEDGRHWVQKLCSPQNSRVSVTLFSKPIVAIKLSDLLAATAGFHPDNIITIGSSHIGTSYKAVLPDGSALVVKRLCHCLLSNEQFQSEMARISQLRHPNLVSLLGFCIIEDEHFLIYKHMPNGSLSGTLSSLEWPSRLLIGVAAARGLAWLHHGFQAPFLHQAFSSNSVLLDEDYEPRITDFGVAPLISSMSSSVDFGELGYSTPEYTTCPIATTKGDVYAFGVVLLELATGQKPAGDTRNATREVFKGNPVDWVNQLFLTGRIQDAIDESLRGGGHDEEITHFLTIACGCVVADPKKRPSMYQIYNSLKKLQQGEDFTEHCQEFPLIYGKDDPEPTQHQMASYVQPRPHCIASSTSPGHHLYCTAASSSPVAPRLQPRQAHSYQVYVNH